MCSGIKGAGPTAWTNFGIKAVGAIADHRREAQEVADINRERLARNERNRWLYHTDYDHRVVGWKSAIVDSRIAVDEKFVEALDGLGKSQLDVWQSIKEGSIAQQEAFAAMMSVSSGETTGPRAGNMKRREAILQYGNKIAQISAARGAGKDAARIYADKVRTRFSNYVHGAAIKVGQDRPVYGAPPARVFLKRAPSMWNPILGIAKAGLEGMMEYGSLTPDDRSTDVPEDDFSQDDYPDWQPGEWTTDDPIPGMTTPESPTNSFGLSSIKNILGVDAPRRHLQSTRAADRLLGKSQHNVFLDPIG